MTIWGQHVHTLTLRDCAVFVVMDYMLYLSLKRVVVTFWKTQHL